MPIYNVLLLVFVVSALGALYPYIFYPAILCLLWACRRCKPSKLDVTSRLPSVSVIIPAHNEENVIEAKLANMMLCLAKVEADKEVIVVSDGSTDRTCEIVRDFGGEVRLIQIPERSGILNALRLGFASSLHDVVLFSDADIQVQPSAISLMLQHYRDKGVGGVCGSTGMHIQVGSGLDAERINVIWRRWVRLMQSRVYSTIGADGANWSLRRGLVNFPTCAVFAEDLVIPLSVVRQGLRYVYEPNAFSHEVSAPAISDEFARKVRTIAGGIQAAFHCKWMFSLAQWETAFHFFSWKIAKYAVGVWAILAVVASLWLAYYSPIFRIVCVIECSAIALGLAGGILLSINPRIAPRALVAAWYLTVANVAPILAAWSLVSGKTSVLWRIAPRALFREASQ